MKAKDKALEKEFTTYRFCAYKSQEHYDRGEYFHLKDFQTHEELKVHSAEHSSDFKRFFEDYISDYWKVETKYKKPIKVTKESYKSDLRDVICKRYSVSQDSLKTDSRAREVSQARYVCILTMLVAGYTVADAVEDVNRDRTTIYNCKKSAGESYGYKDEWAMLMWGFFEEIGIDKKVYNIVKYYA